jgi:TolB-like protein
MMMKKVFMGTAFLCALANFAFAAGQQWAADDRIVYDGESEVLFSYTGPEGVSARVYRNGNFAGSLNSGETKRLVIADGSHTFDVRPGVYDAATQQTVEDTAASKTVTVSSRKNRSSVRIVIAKSGGRNVVSEFGLKNAVAIQTQPKPPETTPAAQEEGTAPSFAAAPLNTATSRPSSASGIEAAITRVIEKFIEDLPQNTSVAVLSVSSHDTDLAVFVVDEIEFQLVDSKRFDMVDRKTLDSVRSEQNFQMSGEVSDSSAVSIGNMLGANIVITGSITGSGKMQRLTVKALDVKTAKIVSMAREPF